MHMYLECNLVSIWKQDDDIYDGWKNSQEKHPPRKGWWTASTMERFGEFRKMEKRNEKICPNMFTFLKKWISSSGRFTQIQLQGKKKLHEDWICYWQHLDLLFSSFFFFSPLGLCALARLVLGGIANTNDVKLLQYYNSVPEASGQL
jgi:hypothetical protein